MKEKYKKKNLKKKTPPAPLQKNKSLLAHKLSKKPVDLSKKKLKKKHSPPLYKKTNLSFPTG